MTFELRERTPHAACRLRVARSLLGRELQFLPNSSLETAMANRNQDYYSSQRRSQQNWRDDDDQGNEADAGTRGGNYDQGRVQYGRRDQRDPRDQNEQSGSTGRYAGYGDFGRGEYGGGRSGWSGQDRYGQSGYGEGDYGQSNSPEGYYRGQPSGSRGVYGQNDYRAGGYGDRTDNDRERSNYGRFGEGGGYGGAGGMGYSGGSGGQGYTGGGYGYGGSGNRGWTEPYGEGQHYGKGPKGYQRSDERIKELISERLLDDPYIDPSEVTVTVQGGKVTLEGTVDSRQAKNAIEEIAEQFGTQDVQNNLRVQRAGQQAQKGKSGEDATSKQKQH